MASSQNYVFIGNEEEVRRFYRCWLVPLQRRGDIHELIGLIYIQGRRKYDPDLSQSQQIINRLPIRISMSENEFIRKIRGLEIAKGLYVDVETERPLTEESLVLYMTMEPGREHQAWYSMEEEMGKRTRHMLSNTNSEWKRRPFKIESLFRTELAKNQVGQYQKLDMDSKKGSNIMLIGALILQEGLQLMLALETKNGYHLVFPRKEGLTSKEAEAAGKGKNEKESIKLASTARKEASKSLYEFCQKHNDWISQEKSAMLAIPGTYQAGHLVKMVNFDEVQRKALKNASGEISMHDFVE